METAFGGSTQVFVKVGEDEVELYGLDIRMIDEHTYELVLKGWL